MTTVDGKVFTTYELDSDESILNRIAISKKTLPKFIKILRKEEENITTLDLIEEIEKFKHHEIEKFFNKYTEYFPDVTLYDIARLWYIHSLKEGDKKIMNPFIEITIDEYLQKYNDSFSKLKRDISNFENDFKSKLEILEKKVKEEVIDFKEFSKQKNIYSTPIEVVRVKTEITFEVEYDIYELFNYMKMSRDIPFAVIGSYYKIMEGFIPSDRWSYTREKLDGDFEDKKDVLYLKTLNVKNEPLKNYDHVNHDLYSTISIYFETPQEETKRKREYRLKELEKKEKEYKTNEKNRKEHQKKELEKIESNVIIRRKNGSKKTNDEIKKKREEIFKEEEKKIKEQYKLEREKREKELEDEELQMNQLESDIVRSSKVYMRLESDVNPDLSENDLISRIFNAFPSKIQIQSRRQIQIKAEFLIPNFYIDSPVFLDAIMNYRIFYQRCFVDERLYIQKEKGGVYMHFAFNVDDSEDKYVTCSMTEQIVEKTNLKIISKDPELKTDTPYLKIRITKIPDELTAAKFRNIFTRLLSVYISYKTDIIDKYKEYINFDISRLEFQSKIEMKRKKSTRTKEMLKDVDSNQFISGYSRSLCPTKRAPRIVGIKDPDDDEDPQEVIDLIDKGKQVMLFPKSPIEDGQTYNQYYYACDHHEGKKEKFIYPALRLNKLSNSDKYPIVPCCFLNDHLSKKNKEKSILRMYYEDDKTFSDFRETTKDEGKHDDEKHIYTTNKILPLKRSGVLIKDIDIYFKSIDCMNSYIRQGVTRSVNSVIEVLLMATREKKFDTYNKDERDNKILSIRKKMIDVLKTSDIYQQTVIYSRNTESIESYLQDGYKYLDPKMFIRLLEEYFKCHIFIFSQNDQYPFGVLSCPNHLKEYLELKTKWDTNVFIYEHMGSEVDRLEYPQCELIVRLDEDKVKKSTFTNDFFIVKRTNEIFNMMYVSPLDKSTNMIISFDTPLKGQGIDFYGKARFLSFTDGVCILTDPLPPLHLPVLYKYKPVDRKIADEFLKRENATSKKFHIIDKKLIGYSAIKGHVKFYISIIPIDTMDENEVLINTPSFIGEKSELILYNELHRLGRYLAEYVLYLFSLYYKYENEKRKKENKEKIEINSEFIIDFVKHNIEIDSEFKYGKVPRIFSMNTGVLKNKKLIVPNETVLKKLIYGLRIRLRNNIEEVKNYSEYKYIQKYYVDIKDFDDSDTQLIIYGQHALIKWIQNVKKIYPLYDNVQHSGISLLSELSKYDVSKLFIVIFTAGWNKPSKDLINRIIFPKNAPKPKTKFERKDLMTEYGHKFNFVYVDIDINRGIANNYNVESIPYIFFFQIENDKLIELGKIKGIDSIYENVKLIKKMIVEILG